MLSSKLPNGDCVDAVILGVGADEFHESDLPTKVKSGNQAVVSPSDLEPYTLSIQHLGFRHRLLDVVRGTPLRDPHELVPVFERSLCLWERVPEFDQHISSNDSHGTV
jgi:hypothetical protein